MQAKLAASAMNIAIEVDEPLSISDWKLVYMFMVFAKKTFLVSATMISRVFANKIF